MANFIRLIGTSATCAFAISSLGAGLSPVAFAMLARPTPGPQNFRIVLDGAIRSGLAQGRYKSGTPVPMKVEFDMPADGTCRIHLTFRPVAGVATVPGRVPLTPANISQAAESERRDLALLLNDSSLGEAGRIYAFNCADFQPRTRVSLPFTFNSNALPQRGSAIDARIHFFGGDSLRSSASVGYATLVLGTDATRTVRKSSSQAINAAQSNLLRHDKETCLRELVADRQKVLPLEVSSVPAETSVDVRSFSDDNAP